jgi:CBS domain containing-hemolysin-like protein
MEHALVAGGLFTWAGIALCLGQSAMFSGLNLAIFSVSRLRLEVEAAGGNRDAVALLELRRESSLTLATILWGNVAVNVLLTLLSDSVLTGVSAFLFSTVVITLFGEIIPQAYFSRHALRMAAALGPVLRIYRLLLFPVAKSTSLLLDWWLGPEAIVLFRERDFRALITRHVEAEGGDMGRLEATGALNFLDIDDIMVRDEGELVDPRSIITVPVAEGRPVLPAFERSPRDPFLRRLDASGKKWVIFTDAAGEPRLVLDAHHFLRDTLFDTASPGPEPYWHRPITVTDPRTRLGEVISRMRVRPEHPADDVIDHDLILLWSDQKRIITGADLLGRLLRGIARREPVPAR